MDRIYVKEICGAEVMSRANVRKLYEILDMDTKYLDMEGVTFISRSVADEIYNMNMEYPNFQIINHIEEVATMLSIVSKGRSQKRVRTSKPKVSMTFNCNTMDDLKRVLLTFGL